MVYVLLALLLFTASVMAHVFFCRTKPKPGLHARAFVLRAGISWGIYAAAALAMQHSGIWVGNTLWGLPFKITGGIVFILLVPIYLCFYVLTQLTSPSQKILSTIATQGSLSYEDIVRCVRQEDFITSRLNDLCASGCVVQSNGRYVLTGEGQKIAATLDFMQFILGRKVGG